MSLHATAPADPAAIRALREEVRSFLNEGRASGRFVPRCDSWLAGHDPDFSRELGSRGWIGLTWPKKYGGGERPEAERHAITEELLAAGAPVAAHWFAQRQSGPLLLRFGTEAQREEFLPKMARGESFFAILLSEPNSGSDLVSVRTRAEKVDGGWRINGQKVWTSHGHESHYGVLLGRTSPPADEKKRHQGLSQFILDLHAEGVTVRPIQLLTGEAHFSEVILENVFVPDDRLVGELGQGWTQVTSELALERSGPERFMSTLPLLLELLEQGVEKDDATAEALGELVAQIWGLRAMSRSVFDALGSGAPDLADRAALVKEVGTRFEQDLVERLRLLRGSEPDPEGSDPIDNLMAQAIASAPGFTLRGGTNEILRGIVARSLGLR